MKELKDNLVKAKEKQNDLSTELVICTERSQAAEQLVIGLESEKLSWQEKIKELNSNAESVLADSLMSSS